MALVTLELCRDGAIEQASPAGAVNSDHDDAPVVVRGDGVQMF